MKVTADLELHARSDSLSVEAWNLLAEASRQVAHAHSKARVTETEAATCRRYYKLAGEAYGRAFGLCAGSEAVCKEYGFAAGVMYELAGEFALSALYPKQEVRSVVRESTE
jgi:hypothetical protein